MESFAKNVIPIRIEDEMRNSYMDYSMSVIIGRALPDVRDGLKPVHRRILYAMHREGLHSNKKYSKCAGVVGEVLKKYHPHGDSAVYDALVRMAQPWNLRYLLVDGQGNFGSVDGDPAAAYRYTECRMTKLAEEMLVDIDKETVSYVANFDGQVEEPTVLPSRLPNLLVNGADGIAVGMATKIPPHNLVEVINGCIALIENPQVELSELMEFIPGPDFPTGGTIYGRKGVWDAYDTGRGRVVIRGNASFEELSNNRKAIIIDELPYQVNKARLIEHIAELVRDKKVDGIHTLRDESDRQGMRIVVELKMDAFEEVVLNHLFKHTALQSTFGVILLAIVNQRPRVLTLREMLSHYIAHRREVILRRTRYDLKKARERAHILEGYRIALDNLDEIITLIRNSPGPAEARTGLMERFDLSEIQAQAILDLRLQRLTGMERQKIEDEYAEVLAEITRLASIIGSEELLMGVVKSELIEIRDQYGDERRTRIVDALGEVSIRDLVAEEDQVVTLSHLGYIKRCSPDEWRMQRRGGHGKRGMTTRDSDFVTSLMIANTHDTLLVFTSGGKVFPLPVHEVPEAGRVARGRPIVNLVPVPEDESIAAVISVHTDDEQGRIDENDETELFFVSRNGLVKRTPLNLFRNLRQGGMIACGVAEGDQLVVVRHLAEDMEVEDPESEEEDESGEPGDLSEDEAELAADDDTDDADDADDADDSETADGDTEAGDSKTADGDTEAGEETEWDCHMMLFSREGQCIRFAKEQVPVFGRTARGNRGIRLVDGDEVVDALIVPPSDDEASDDEDEDLDELVEEEVEDDDEEGVDSEAEVEEEPWETTLLTVTSFGYGKRTPLDEYRSQNRNGKGILSHRTNDKTGEVVSAVEVAFDDQIMVVTDTGRIIRFPSKSVRVVGRVSQGVRLMRLDEGEAIVDCARLEESDEEEEDEVSAEGEDAVEGEDASDPEAASDEGEGEDADESELSDGDEAQADADESAQDDNPDDI